MEEFERAALENLRNVVRAEIRERDRKTGFFDEAKAWTNIRNALGAC
jgi:hypothetical protein